MSLKLLDDIGAAVAEHNADDGAVEVSLHAARYNDTLGELISSLPGPALKGSVTAKTFWYCSEVGVPITVHKLGWETHKMTVQDEVTLLGPGDVDAEGAD